MNLLRFHKWNLTIFTFQADNFQSDIFPPALSSEPSLSAGEFFSGKTPVLNLVNLDSGAVFAGPQSQSQTPISAPAAPAPTAVAVPLTKTASLPAPTATASSASPLSPAPVPVPPPVAHALTPAPAPVETYTPVRAGSNDEVRKAACIPRG